MPNPHTRAEPSLFSVRRFSCPNCDSRMVLARITSGPKGFDLHTFECSKCDHHYTTAIAKDPMNPASAGWIVRAS
jgi:transcription elongation factor Elf1